MIAGATATASIAHRQHLRRRLGQRLLRADVLLPLEVTHLPPALGKLTVAARTVRLMLQTPVTRYLEAPLRASPWGRRQVCDEYDLALCDARRALWEWIGQARRLGLPDRARLRGMGIDLAPIAEVFAAAGVLDRTDDVWDAGVWPRAPNLRRTADELSRAIESLGRFETAMLTASSDPYR